MPPPLALFLTIAFAVFLFRRDFRDSRNVTAALWIPLVWLLLIGSRPLSHRLSIFGVPMGPSSTEEGTPIDAFVYLILIALAVYVLNRRQINLAEVFRDNGWLIAFLLYCFLATLWSDIPFTAFKRWIKVLGHPVMILLVFTEPDPAEAYRAKPIFVVVKASVTGDTRPLIIVASYAVKILDNTNRKRHENVCAPLH